MTTHAVTRWREQSTRIVRHEFRLGCSTRAARAPDRRLRPLLHRDLLGFHQERAAFERWLEPPRPALTLMVDLEGALSADGTDLPGAWIGGLSDTYTLVGFGATYASVDIELTPLGAYTLLGRRMDELAGRVVALEDLFGASGRRLGERIRALASELGCSRRYLHTKFAEEVGLPPKTVARLIRFEHLCRRLEHDPVGWADIAVEAGYCDQSHLNRDFRDLAGTTPTEFLARRIPGGGLVGDEIPFIQDSAAAAA